MLSCPFGRIIVGKTSASTPPFDLKLFILTWKIFAQFLIVSFYFRFNFNLMWHIIIVVVIVIVITITTRIIIKTKRDDGGKKKYTNMFAIRFSFKYSPFRIQIFFSKMSRHTQMLDLDFVVWHHATLENVDNSEQNRLQKMVIIAKCCWENWQRRTHTKSPLQVNTFRSEIKSLRTKANEGHQKKVESMACKAKAKIWAKKWDQKPKAFNRGKKCEKSWKYVTLGLIFLNVHNCVSMNSCCDFNFTSSKIKILGMEITFDVIFIFRFAIALIRNGVENEWIKKKKNWYTNWRSLNWYRANNRNWLALLSRCRD